MPAEVFSVYVHAPFCARRCFYCDFAVQVRREGDAGEWLHALRCELEALEKEGLFLVADTLETLYVGGGTPSVLGPAAMAGLAELVGPGRLRSRALEWTAEANPESLTPAVARAWRKAGVNRLSLGVQSFQEPVLRWMGRLHGGAGARSAVRTARRAGFDNLSVDLIFGLPSHLERDWRGDLEGALGLDVEHVSLYGLSVEPETPLGRAVASGSEPPVDEERYREEFLLAAELLTAEGYEHYEVSNFARPGARSRHNARYWSGDPYLGLGNGAHSYAPPLRRWNERDWQAYREGVEGGEPAVAGREIPGEEERRLERIWLALRTAEGLAVSDLSPAALALAEAWVSHGRARREGGRVRLTPEGWLLLDLLAVELDQAAAG